jgi:hypothetical protein
MNDKLKKGLFKTQNYWGVCSLILGILSIISALSLSFFGGIFGWNNWDLFWVGMLISAVFALSGLGLGIKGLKSPGRKYSRAGITICILGLLFWLYLTYAWLSTDPW